MRKRQAASATRREIYEAERRRRSLAVAAASTAVVVLALIVLVPLAPGWEKVQKSFFNGAVLAKSFPRLLDAFKVNVMIFAWSAPSIAILGLLIALARGVRAPTLFPLRIFATIYTDVFRGVPVILTVYLIGFGIPGLGLPRPWNSPYIWGSVALVLTYSAYVAEIFRSGIDSVHHSQRSAALSLGLSEGQAMRDVILPQAVRNVVPSQMNMLIALQKMFRCSALLVPLRFFDRLVCLSLCLLISHPMLGPRSYFWPLRSPPHAMLII